MANLYTQTTSSSSSSTCKYDVFLSFRGPDTRTTFTDHLYTALTSAGARTFRDKDDIEVGEKINSELESAIKSSKMSIIVFSETYPSSKACLQEVETILEHHMKSGHHFLPVFYHIEPANLKDQAQKGLPDVDAAQERKKRWSMALDEVASIAGMRLEGQHVYESKFIRQIVTHVTQKIIPKVLPISDYLVGMDSRVHEINLWLKDDEATVAKILVIFGMGGAGKTTAAKYIYNSHYSNFDASSFLGNIRDTCIHPKNLIGLQRQLLSEISSGKEQAEIYSIHDGIRRIEYVLGNKKVLLVLDDVDEVKQLDAIIGRRNWISGSKIIITTRREDLLKASENYVKHKIKTLDNRESLQLFSMHAFERMIPSDGYLEHSKKYVSHCQGLPLALEVIGSSLAKTSLDEWVTQLHNLDTMPDKSITKMLKISYDSLESDHDKNLFLDIACFFARQKKNKVIEILDGCDYVTTLGIKRLASRNLLTFEKNDKLGMHQWLQRMGRNIVLNESKCPERRSRLWHTRECFDVLTAKTGSADIEGLVFDMNVLKKEKFAPKNSYCQSATLFSWLSGYLSCRSSNDEALKTDTFANMHNLRLLKLCYVPISGTYKEFPKSVRWLYWRGFPLRSLPNDFPLENIVYLDLRYSSLEQLWKETKVLESLKILNLSHSSKLTKTPNFSGVPNLQKLLLKDCQSLVEVDESIANLGRLIVLNLQNCKSLRMLPRSIDKIKSLQELNVSGCSNIVLPKAQRETVESLRLNHIRLPRNLLTLSLKYMNLSDDDFPKSFASAPMLTHLYLGGNPIHSLPNSIKDLGRLQFLDLFDCTRLEQILWPSVSLEKLSVIFCSSLKQITFETFVRRPQRILRYECRNLNYIEGCFKIEPLGKVDGDVLDNIGFFNLESMANTEVTIENIIVSCSTKKLPVQILYEEGVFSTYFPHKEVPDRFTYKSNGRTISFTIPMSSCLEIRGMSLCLVYTFSSISLCIPCLGATIINKSNGAKWICIPSSLGMPEVDGAEMVWLSYWMSPDRGNLFEEGSQVEVSFKLWGGQIKECGVQILYHNEEGGGKVHYYKTLQTFCAGKDFIMHKSSEGGTRTLLL